MNDNEIIAAQVALKHAAIWVGPIVCTGNPEPGHLKRCVENKDTEVAGLAERILMAIREAKQMEATP